MTNEKINHFPRHPKLDPGRTLYVLFAHASRAKPAITGILLWCVLGALLTLGFMEAAAIARFPSASLRYNEPITGQAAQRARQYSIENIQRDTFWPTFWHQSSATLSAGARTAQVNAISFSGDAALVWPTQYITGSAPSSIDGSSAAVSQALAHRLWGSTDIIGMPIYVDDVPHTVRGVFEGTAELALLSFHIEDTSQNWTAVELSGGAPHPTRSNAESFALASGLGRPDYVLMGGAITLARFMSMLPLLIPAVYALALLVRFVKKHYRTAGTPIIFAGFILLAILLPLLLNAIPPWLIPTHWSDFSFWSSLLHQANGGLREFFSVNPMLRDVELKMHLLRQAGIMIVAICCGIIICARQSTKMSE